ncbi:glycosyltransferase [Bacteroides congonensis]|uniref:glycosyltransferase family 2 protein n=1 Tax=Bacteroides congonensis TaxID=1871006 RepID=UPI00321904DD
MHPFISLIMPVYNNEKYFPKAVQSVIAQSFHDWELVIVEDGSTDNTPMIADKLAETDERIRVVHQQNQWIYASVNNGTEIAAGKYVFMFNSDDLLNQDALQRIHDIAVIDDADIVMFNLSENTCDEEQNIIERDVNGRSRYLADDFSYTDRDDIHRKWIDFMKLGLVNHQCVYKAKLAKKNKMRNDTYAGDYLYNIQLADQINVAAGTAYEVYMYMNYQKEEANISLGKYYGYEHDMYNGMYLEYKALFEQWGIYGNEVKSYLSKLRMQKLSREFRLIKIQRWSVDEKLKEMLNHISDDIIHEIASENNKEEELESRMFSACRELFIENVPDQESDFYFLYELLDSLLRYEKTQEDLEKIRAGVYHELNPKHIGKCFMQMLVP